MQDQSPEPNHDPAMTGAEALVHTLLASEVTTCFANPGTSEMHFVAALDRIPGIACVLGLQENVVTGMADGYFRITGKPAATLLHCGPGLANGIANLHNARRAGAGVVNVVGDHAIAHVPFDSPLTADVAALAGACSQWYAYSTAPERIGPDAARAVQAAGAGYGQIATLVLPADVSWGEGGQIGAPLPAIAALPVVPSQIDHAAGRIRQGGRTIMILGTPALSDAAQPLLAGLKAAGIELMASPLVANQPMGRGRMAIPRVPYVVEVAMAALAPFDTVILVNCPPPTAFFLYPGRPSLVMRADAEVITLSRGDQDALAGLKGLMASLGIAPATPPAAAPREKIAMTGPIEPEGFAEVVCDLLPDQSIVIDEALTLGGGFPARLPAAAPCNWLPLVGGAIGEGLPMATGAAIGAREQGEGHRRVIDIQADGSAAYTLQALWTQARENLPCTTLLLNNRKYAILLGEYAKVGANPGQTAFDMLSLDRPAIDWAGLAQSFGVRGVAVETLEALHAALAEALAHDGPMLIDVRFA
ncbi:acetolactate synthase large subunit [Paracoccus aminophilus]|uniref:Benzoylformate decarboxylase n=1 Tax=Paracoccus aminophilus JCM 7686 TaxID=1367847 RepID=S5XQU8_PARAH|nr:acetolactate synthase large subunit [Paracoccus aminophilus]AGT09779.1 benzoylformate decarboxylase [Paracoccus aminophilus JCM 7686]